MGMRYVGSKGGMLPKDALILGLLGAPFTCGFSLFMAALFCAYEEHQDREFAASQTYYTKPYRK